MNKVLSSRARMSLISLVIVSVLGLQSGLTLRILCPPKVFSFLSPLRAFCAPTFWPFMDYPMYREPYYEGDQYNQFVVMGILENSAEVEIQSDDLGMGFWQFRGFIDALVENDEEQIETYVELYQNRHNQLLLGLRLESHPLILSEQGFEPRSLETRQVVRFEQPEKATEK